MATEFKRVQAALDAAHGDFTKISDESLGLDDRIAALRALQAVFKEYDGEVARMAVRAAETDPDRKVYGPSMVVKVTELVKTYQDFKEKVAPVCERVQALQHAAEREASVAREAALRAAEAEAVAAAEIRRRIAEEEAQRIEIARREVEREEAAKAAALKTAQEERERKEEQRRQAAAERLRAEAQAKADAERVAAEAAEAAAQQEKEARKRRAEEIIARHKPVEVPSCASKPFVLEFSKMNRIETEEQYRQATRGHPDVVVVMKIYSPSCTPCIMSAPTLDCLAAKFPTMFFACVRGDLPQNQAFLPTIRGFPTFMFHFRGSVIDTIVGANMKLLFEAVVKAGQTAEATLVQEAIAMSEAGECGKSVACSLPTDACPLVEAVGLTRSVAEALSQLQNTVSKSEFRKALKAFSEYIGMIEANPSKGASIPVNCISFRSAVGRHAAGGACMCAIGFKMKCCGADGPGYVFQPLTESDEDTLKLVDLATLHEFLNTCLATDCTVVVPGSCATTRSSSSCCPSRSVDASPPPRAKSPQQAPVAAPSSASADDLTEEELIARALQMSMEEDET